MNKKWKWIKNPKWTWRTDLLYYLHLPKELLKALHGIIKKDHILNEMGWWEYLDLACAFADMKSGRWYFLEQNNKR